MGKVVKLKLKDVEKIVKNVMRESEFDDFDTQIQPEELPNADELGDPELQKELQSMFGDFHTEIPNPSDDSVKIGKDPDTGEIYVFRVGTGEILGKK